MHRSFIDRLLLPTIVGLTTVLAALLLCQRLLTQQRAEIQETTKAHASLVRDKMEAELKARVLPLERMARRWQIRGQPNDIDLESDATLAMIGYRGYQAIEWVDPTFHLRWLTPRRGNQVELGVDLGSDPRLRGAFQAADEKQQAIVTRPLDLPQGGRGFVVCVPILPKEKSGFLLGMIRYQEMLPSILEDVAQDYWVEVYDGGEQVYSRAGASGPREEPWAQETQVKFQQLTWRVRVWPKPEALAYAQSFLPQVALAGGILMAGLLAFAVYLAETSQLRAREVASANRELKRQIAG